MSDLTARRLDGYCIERSDMTVWGGEWGWDDEGDFGVILENSFL